MQTEALIISQKEIVPGFYLLVLASQEIVDRAQPGQFLHVRCGNSYDPLLRRPISIHALDHHKGEVTLLYRVVGAGTKMLAEKKAGEKLDVLGPLGHGFTLPAEAKKIVLVGGGIGAAPLFTLAQAAVQAGNEVCFLLGASSERYLLVQEQLERLGVDLSIATDDGSAGWHGNTVDLLARLLIAEEVDLICACGPHIMLKGIARLALRKGIDCQVSLEEKMACGVGACLGCVCQGKREDGQDTYKKVCQHGPVFAAKEVNWDV